MLNNKKRVFWEALLLVLLIFLMGFLIGIVFEERRVDIIGDYYLQSENSLMDILALNNFVNLENTKCGALINSNIDFANRIYEEAKILERYEASEKISDNLELQHKKYDIMRTFLWINTMKTNEICENNETHVVVYLYKYYEKDLTVRATNSVWSKILGDLKEKQGNEIILIPIAVDNNVSALNLILENFNIEKYPVVIIDNEHVIEELSSVEEIEKHF